MTNPQPGDIMAISYNGTTTWVLIMDVTGGITPDTTYLDCRTLADNNTHLQVPLNRLELLYDQGLLKVLKQPNLNNLRELYL